MRAALPLLRVLRHITIFHAATSRITGLWSNPLLIVLLRAAGRHVLEDCEGSIWL
jgi:hypothetical protein